ncbi:hypothetical protein FRB99_006801 [Tulasnella sp. 403]|nr:hypothetical protein FRB99_006801 [Tulasnella sp. 403]
MSTPTPKPPPTVLSHRGVDASVRVDGQKLPCFGIDIDKEKNLACCWIPSEDGKTFTVYCRAKSKIRLEGQIFFDGNRVCADVAHSRTPKEGIALLSFETCMVSNTEERPFTFAKIIDVDSDNEDANASADVKSPGTILVRIYRVRVLSGLYKYEHSEDREIVPSETPKVPEKRKKAGPSHATQ